MALTMDYELARAQRAVGLAPRLRYAQVAAVAEGANRLLGGRPPALDPLPPPADYQLRRDVNLRRLGLCDALVAPSPRVAEIYAELGVDRARLRVQRLALPHLERLVPRRPPGVGAPLLFVTLGSAAAPSKGARVLVEAVRALEEAGRDYRLAIHGTVDDDAAAALAAVPSVELGGRYGPADLDRLLDGADVGIVPSVWEEAHGFVGIEMLAKGLPLIGSALGGIPEYVRDGETGWLNRSATGAELASLMAAAIEDPAAVERLQRSVRERRAELVRPHADHVAEVEALYAELTADQAATISSPAARRAGS
jgi:glycosyltransferase involved in cell wall biosynthesis